MKISQTNTTVTTLDTTARADRNVHGGSPLRVMAIVATVERGTFSAGAPSKATQDAHQEALAELGWRDSNPDQITRGCKSVIYLDQAPENLPR